MGKVGLADPLGAARMCTDLEDMLCEIGYSVTNSEDMGALSETKMIVRGHPSAPMHDSSVAVLDGGRAFWMQLVDNATGNVVGLQAYRCDQVDTNLADWCVNYMIGIYMRRQELMVPSHVSPPSGSIALRLAGRLVYHGECWISQNVRNRKVFEVFVRLGTLLSHIKWQPDAVWALVNEQMARNGFHTRAGYTIIEKGFLRWLWASEGVAPVEFLIAVERDSIEAMIDEHLTTGERYPPEQSRISP